MMKNENDYYNHISSNPFNRKGKKVKLEICVNKFTSDKEPIRQITIIDSIAIDEKYMITSESRCFQFNQDSLEIIRKENGFFLKCTDNCCLLYTSPSPRDATLSRMPSSA